MRQSPAISWTVAAIAAISAAAAVFILQQVRYPFPPERLQVFWYLLYRQDLLGLALVVTIALLACLPRLHRPALALVDAIGRHPWRCAVLVFAALCLGTLTVAHNHALAGDEYLTLMQSRIFAEGRLTGQYPPELLGWLVPDRYRYRWIMLNASTGEIAAAYWPGFAMVLTPFTLLGIPWACNPLLAALALALIGRLAARVTGNAAAAGWAMLFALASPGFAGLALSYFSMTAHLLVNLAFSWLLLEPDRRRVFLAGLLGSAALLLHQPLPHILYALPWIAWLGVQPQARRNLSLLALGYLPALVLGLAWAAFLREMHGPVSFEPFPADGEWLHRLGNFIWYWQLRLGWVMGGTVEYSIAARVGEQVRLWAWSAPGLLLIAGAGAWLERRNAKAMLLAASFVATLAGYLAVSFDQGYGWGARYVHSAWGALPILAAAAMVRLREAPRLGALRGWAAAAAALSLALATALRGWQISDYLAEHLARRPAYVEGARQFVFVRHDQDLYTQDLAQNDPFLRRPVVFLVSRGRDADAQMMQRLFPQARRVQSDARGEVWRFD